MKSNRNLLILVVVALLLVGVAIRNQPDQALDDASAVEAAVEAGQAATDSTVGSADVQTEQRFSDLPVIDTGELPIEAIETLLLIADGGPYPFDRDDLTFQNREGLLPDRPQGHYREYTVITPGEDDRGARRVVAGADGERYYTADHYSSFREIVLPGGSG